MREIKFRVWETSDLGETYSMNYMEKEESLLIFFTYHNDDNLMQYTGLLDNNGKEIYEGDILTEKWKCTVYEANGCFMIRFGTNPKGNMPSTLFQFMRDRNKAGCPADIIGNIHES